MSYGSDWRDLGSLDFSRLEGKKLLKRSLIRRLTTPKESLFYAPEYGFDLRQFVNADWDSEIESQLITGAQNECEQDKRIIEATVSVTERGLNSLRLRIVIIPRDESELTLDLIITNTEVSSV
jgi:hypothetical protein